MRAYADSSFILRLIVTEPGSEAVIAEYRRLRRPSLFFHSLHALEIQNAILQRAFHRRRSESAEDRRSISRDKDAELARFSSLIKRRFLLEVTFDFESILSLAQKISLNQTERIGARAIDLLHVTCAVSLETEYFFTTDYRQAELAKAEGLKVMIPDS